MVDLVGNVFFGCLVYFNINYFILVFVLDEDIVVFNENFIGCYCYIFEVGKDFIDVE